MQTLHASEKHFVINKCTNALLLMTQNRLQIETYCVFITAGTQTHCYNGWQLWTKQFCYGNCDDKRLV